MPNLLRKVKVEGKWKLQPVVYRVDSTGAKQYDFSRVLIAGKPVVAPEGAFYLEYREPGAKNKTRRTVGEDPREVKAAMATQASVLDLRAMGVEVADAPQIRQPAQFDGKTIRAVVDDFVKSPPLEYRRKSYTKYRNALRVFGTWAARQGKTHVIQLGRQDIKDFMTAVVREDGLDTSTAVDKALIVVKIMRDAGAPIAMLKGDWPKVTERQPEMYRPETLKALFAAADEDQYETYQLFLQSGFREMEAANVGWENFDAHRCTLSVKKKPGFDPKSYQERTVPVPGLVKLLERRRKRQLKNGLDGYYILGTAPKRGRGNPGFQPDSNLLEKLKMLAFKSGLNCGRCTAMLRHQTVTCKTAPVCKEFGLHKFRHTCATTLLRDGMDLKSLQLFLGHKDLASTEKYVRALEPADLLEKVRRSSLATRFVEGPRPTGSRGARRG